LEPAAAVAAAARAAAAAVLDPGGQLISGLQQRLLAYLAKRIAQKQACDVAPSMWDFQYNFGVFSSLVVYRARLLDRQHLLLKLGAPTSGPAATAELSPSRVHFFALYDVLETRFKGFWRGADSQLLTAVMAQPAQLLAASQDMSPWDRCCAAALYPPGFAIGLAEEEQQGQGQQQGQQQQQGQHPSRWVSRQESGSRGSRAAAAAGAAASQQQQPTQQQQQGQQQQPVQRQSSNSAAAAAGNASLAHTAAAGSTAAAVVAAAGPGLLGTADATAAAAGAGGSSSKAARERLKLLRQVVLLVLPGLQVSAHIRGMGRDRK
jgi:hypothetical protein